MNPHKTTSPLPFTHLLISFVCVSCNSEVLINEGVKKLLSQLGGNLSVRCQWEHWTPGSIRLDGGKLQ